MAAHLTRSDKGFKKCCISSAVAGTDDDMLGVFYVLALSNTNILQTAYSPALIYFGRERGWWITCNYPTVLKEKNIVKQKEYNLRYLLAKVRTT
jgi:hypothetical protein